MGDFLNRKLKVGDHVVMHGPKHDTLTIGQITNMWDDGWIEVTYYNDWNPPYKWSTCVRKGNQLFKITPAQATIFKLMVDYPAQ